MSRCLGDAFIFLVLISSSLIPILIFIISILKLSLNCSSFSKEGLYDQLIYEKFTSSEARYAVDNCGADWKEQAVLTAASYMKISSFSKQGLIDQLVYEKFTHDQAVYGAEQNGY